MVSRAAVDDVADVMVSPSSTGPKNLHRSRFRIGRLFLLLEGMLVVLLAAVAIGVHGAAPVQVSAGFTFWGLTLTPVRCGLLLAFGLVAVAATLNRHATMAVTAVALATSGALTVLGDVALAAGVPHQWGVDPHNAGLYAVLVVYNLALVIWLLPDMSERRDGVETSRRKDDRN